jgi:hypothetical protein
MYSRVLDLASKNEELQEFFGDFLREVGGLTGGSNTFNPSRLLSFSGFLQLVSMGEHEFEFALPGENFSNIEPSFSIGNFFDEDLGRKVAAPLPPPSDGSRARIVGS